MTRCPTRNPKLAWREIDGEIVIISPQDSRVHELNETASLIWKCADGTQSRAAIAERMAAEFDVAIETACQDVAEIIEVLGEKDLILSAVAAAV
jgi:hypothetical protein